MLTIAVKFSLNYSMNSSSQELQETHMSESRKPQASRRGFMLGAAAAGAATAVVATLPLSEPAEAPVTEKKPAPENGGGYHVTDHIKSYYKTTLV